MASANGSDTVTAKPLCLFVLTQKGTKKVKASSNTLAKAVLKITK